MEEIATVAAYEGRKDLGNTQPGDGRRFKGRGPIQITGRANYLKAGDALQLDLLAHPDLLADPKNGVRAAAWWWTAHRLSQTADSLTLTGDARDLAQFDKLTKTINGGYNGRVDRHRRYLDCINATSDEDFATPTAALPGDGTIAGSDGTNPGSGGTKGLSSGTKSPSDETPPDLITKLAADPKRRSMVTKLGMRLGTPAATLLMALQAGNKFAWLAVTIIAIGLGVLVFFERRAIARFLQENL